MTSFIIYVYDAEEMFSNFTEWNCNTVRYNFQRRQHVHTHGVEFKWMSKWGSVNVEYMFIIQPGPLACDRLTCFSTTHMTQIELLPLRQLVRLPSRLCSYFSGKNSKWKDQLSFINLPLEYFKTGFVELPTQIYFIWNKNSTCVSLQADIAFGKLDLEGLL